MSTPDEDFQRIDKPGKSVIGRMYLAMPDVRALAELVQLWQRYVAGHAMERGFAPWRDLFDFLRDVRPWGPPDRIPRETLDTWKQELATHPQAVRFEVEFWFRENAHRREQALDRLRNEVQPLGGQIIHHAAIEEIRYAAALVDLPAEQIEALLANPTIHLARADDIMFLRPQSVARVPPTREDEAEPIDMVPPPPVPLLQPIAALFDGVPMQNHTYLSGRLIVDDPEGLEARSPVDRRQHGTAMASLILHGDLNRPESVLHRPLYVRPLLHAPQAGPERTPEDRLLVDVLYRAVKRMKEGDEEGAAAAPSVVVVNLSLGDHHRPFTGPMSPWARLVDFLAHRYRLLFLISAGNVTDSIRLPDYETWTAFEAADPEERERHLLQAVNANKAHRTLLSPAESLNALTIGAWHKDAIVDRPPRAVALDPYPEGALPNLSSAVGLGRRKIVKPEILFDGGREFVTFRRSSSGIEVAPVPVPGRYFGLKAAVPDPQGHSGRVTHISGTSAATALATRAALRIVSVLTDGEIEAMAAGGPLDADRGGDDMAVVLKALLVHGAAWGTKGGMLDGLLGPQGKGAHPDPNPSVTEDPAIRTAGGHAKPRMES